MIAGLGDDNKPFICTMDSIGAKYVLFSVSTLWFIGMMSVDHYFELFLVITLRPCFSVAIAIPFDIYNKKDKKNTTKVYDGKVHSVKFVVLNPYLSLPSHFLGTSCLCTL